MSLSMTAGSVPGPRKDPDVTATEFLPEADRRLASTHPAAPAPTMM